jgi:two-component system, NtrC family, sensor histidine kinase HydH
MTMWKSIIAPAVVVSLCWLMVGGASSYYLSWLDRATDRVLTENVVSIRAANEMEGTVWRMQAVALEAARERSHVSAETLRELEADFQKSLQEAESAAKQAEEQSVVQRIREAFADYSERWRRTSTGMVANEATLSELVPLVPHITQPCEELLRINEKLISESSRRRQELTAWVMFGRAAMLVIGPGLGLLLGFRLAGQLHRSITRISVRLQAVAGDLEQEVGRLEVTPQADLPAIQAQLDVIADRIRGVVQELHQARRETMRAERLAAVGELAAGVAHELRNPLTSVKLLIQTMQHRLQEKMPPQTFDVVLEEISRMESTIQGLLDFARPPKLQRARHDLRQIVRRAVNLTEGKARQNGVALATHLANEPVWANADAEQLHQVCINLLLNGIESMTTGGVFDIHVDADEAAAVARVRFEDGGAGIPDSVLPRLFEPFVTSKDHGTGLGLAVSRRIVSNHSGRLLAENRCGGGAALTIELPLDHVPVPRVRSHAHAVAS